MDWPLKRWKHPRGILKSSIRKLLREVGMGMCGRKSLT